MQHPQQVHFLPDPSLPPGQSDLEALERLKETIKNNQHEIFRAVPRPAVLARLYKGSLPSLASSHPEQTSSNLSEKRTTTPSGPSFETLPSSSLTNDAHRAHVASVVQGASSISRQGRSSMPTRPSISSDALPSSPVEPRDQSHLLTNGRSTLPQISDDPLHPIVSQFEGASSEDIVDVNGTGATVGLGSSPPSRLLTDSAFAPRDPLRRDGSSDMERTQPHLLSSPERRHPGPDDKSSAPLSVYMSDRERPPLHEMRLYDCERDYDRTHEAERTHEQDRERERQRRWSLSDHRRLDLDHGRRRPSYDRRPPHNDDRRLPRFENKHAPSFVDRRMVDDRHFPGYEHRSLSEEVRTGYALSQNRPQEGNERRLGPAMKTHVPAPSSVPSPGVAAVVMASDPVNPAVDGTGASDHRPTGSTFAPTAVDNQGISAPRFAVPLEERSGQPSSLHERISGTYLQLGSRGPQTQHGLLLEERLTNPLENPTTASASLPGTSQPVDDLSHNRVSEPDHAIDLRPGLNNDRERYSLPTMDNQTRPGSAAYSRGLSVGRDESKPQPPPLRTSTPSTFSSAQTSLSLRAREPSRERPPNFRPYIRSEFSRPLEEIRRPDAHSLQPGDGNRRYDERGRWSPPPYGDRRSYREYYDRDRPYWDGKDRARDRPPPPPQLPPPPHWDRERTRYPDPPYTSAGLDRRLEDRDQGNRNRWYPPPHDNSSRRQFDTFAPRGRPRSPGSPSREPSELRPPPLKRVRDEAYVGGHGTMGDDYYTHPHHPPPNTASAAFIHTTPVPIPIPRPASPLPLPPRYNHSRPLPLEPYAGPYGGYERDGGRGPAGPSFPREGAR
ncbi:hypothetical protein BJV74DRAFT_863899 [Russula compacta]|nr:hypothetical protein BJV74DRAFT_863899 [Russula compacta]